MRILFVNYVNYLQSPFPEGIALLSALLKQQGHEVELFDTAFLKRPSGDDGIGPAGITFYKKTPYSISDLVQDDPVEDIEEKFVEIIERFNPALVAVSAMTTNYEQSLNLVKTARACTNRPFKVIFGGVHPTLMPDDVIDEDVTDYICVGEGEEALSELCRRLDKGSDVSDIENLYIKKDEGSGKKIVKNGFRPFINLDSLPTPDLSIFDPRYFFKPFQGHVYRGIFMCSSRGCPRGCAYCVNNKLNRLFKDCGKSLVRFQSPRILASHIEFFKNNYGVNWIRFSDDTFLSRPLEDLQELARLLKPLDIMFGCAIDPVTVTEEKVKAAKEMGCVSMSIGVETGNEAIRRKVLGRQISNEQIRKAFKIVRNMGIKVSAFNMIGLPGETKENVYETIRFNKELGVPDANLYILYPFPETRIYHDCNLKMRFRERIPSMNEAYTFNLSKMTQDELLFFFKTFNLYLVLPETCWDRIEASREFPQEYDTLVRIAQDMVDQKKL